MGVSAISIKNLSKWYDDFKVIDNLNLEVKEGEFFGFLGPNGAGKTTTINSITGLATFQNGSISVLGHDVVLDYRHARSLIGLSQQEYNFDDFFNVEKILKHQGGYFGLSGKELSNRVEEILDLLKLTDKKRTDVIKLSGGMKRRLMLAKALVGDPKVLILDEPTSGVDVELRHELWDLFRRLNREGITIFLTTHYIEEAERLCDRIGIINKGKIIELDSTKNLKAKYSKKLIEIEIVNKLTAVPNVLKLYNPTIVDNSLRLECRNPVLALEKILALLRKSKMAISNIRITESSLEKIYLELTK